MKRRHHLSFSGLLGALAVYRELWAELPGTGQSIMGLMKAGWTRLEIAEFFPWTAVNWLLLLGAILWAATNVKSKREAGSA